MKKNKTIIILVASLLCLLLASCRSKEEGPEAYDVTGDTVPSINKLLDGEGGVLESMELPADSKEGDSEDEANTEPETSVYHYKDLPNGGQTIEAYVTALTSSEVGFSVINGSGKQTDAPDFTAETGSLTLSRPNLDLRKNLLIDLAWEKSSLTATVYLADGASGKAGSGASTDVEAMTAEDAVFYLKGLSPTLLGIPGESMKEYHVYYVDGKAMVDGVSFLRLRVYQISPPEGSNAILATYFLNPDKSSLYRLNPETSELQQIALS